MCKSQRPESRHQLSPSRSKAPKTQISGDWGGDWGCFEPPCVGPSPTFAASCRPFSSEALMCQSEGRSGPSCCDITALSPRRRRGRHCGRRSAGNTPRSSRRGKGRKARPCRRGGRPKRQFAAQSRIDHMFRDPDFLWKMGPRLRVIGLDKCRHYPQRSAWGGGAP